jgi:putative tricarboxylic transport membrane protein
MSLIDNLQLGFSVALLPSNLFLAFVGCLVGTLIGVLPGLGPLATIAMLLPITFYFPPESALIMLAGIYYGAQYGGSTTAILVNLPGESSSAVTCIDGHQMARQGRAGAALAIAALGSFFAGSVATLLVAAFAIPLSRVALLFGPVDYFALMLFGLVGATALSSGSMIKSVAMVLVGILLGCIGLDINSGVQRFTGGSPSLMGGIDFVVLAIGLFGISDIMATLSRGEGATSVITGKVSGLWPSRSDFMASWGPVVRGTGLGSILGILPGGGALLSSFASYALEKKIATSPELFGHGAVQGVAGPEAANNAGAQTSFIPMLTLGIPSNAVMAVMIGALMIQGISPGPQVMTDRPELVWGLIASMWVGNVMLVVINLPLIGIWVRLLKVPYSILYPFIVLFCCIGAYSIGSSAFDVLGAAALGFLGFLMLRYECPIAPLAMGFILGPMMEENFRRAMILSRGDMTILVTEPISACFIIGAVGLLVSLVAPNLRAYRKEAFQNAD